MEENEENPAEVLRYSKNTTSEIFPVTKDGQTLVKAVNRFCRSSEGTILFNSG